MNSSNAIQHFSVERIQAWLTSHLAELLGIEVAEVDIQAPLDSYGLDSAQGMFLIAKGGEFFGFQLSPLLLWHYPTIELLSQRLAEEAQASESEVFEI